MNRTQKKCFIASAGLHLLLLLILFIGPAFLSAGNKSDNLPVLNFVPVATVDAAVSGGGNPTAPPPAPAPPTPPPPQVRAPQPPPEPRPEPVRVAEPEPPKPQRPSPEAFEPVKEHKHVIQVNDKLVVRNSNEVKEAANAARAKAAADRRRESSEINRALANIKSGFSPSTSIELQGPGGGGIPYGNFLAAVKKVYSDAWTVPDGVTEDFAATISVTIARDGTVISARIIRTSGNSAVDQSVQSVLDRVKYAAPLPEGAKEDQRTVNIVFDVNSKLLG